MTKIKKFITGISISGVAVVLAIALLEGTLRLLTPNAPASGRAKWSDRPNRYFVPSSSASMQGAPPNVAKGPGSFRVIAVGDSFTFGPFMQLDDTYPKRIERMLNLNTPAPLQAEVFNFGFSGTSTVKQVPIVETALADKPDLLILQITLNDAEDHILTPAEKEIIFGAPPFSTGPLSNLRLLRFIGDRLHNSQTHRKYIEYHHGKFIQPKTYQPFRQSIHEIAKRCRDARVPVIFVLFPMFDFPLHGNYPFTATHKIIHDTVAETGAPFLDLLTRYTGIPHERLQVIPSKDSHPNEIAHRIAAEGILEFAITNKSIPAALQPSRVYRARKNLRERPSGARQRVGDHQTLD